ncbi:MAG: hypothetical protein KF833_00660 [Verrucomicrobiae bacterium]|nr:hypothetical protein [Verrucomicrobiae bacterium]
MPIPRRSAILPAVILLSARNRAAVAQLAVVRCPTGAQGTLMDSSPTPSPGPRSAAAPDDDVAWARRVNGRWLVHHGLREDAEAYLDHLAREAPDRLLRSCRRARAMGRQCPPGTDPKPWFYGGLFSLATEEEASRFLAGHWFTLCTVPSVHEPAKAAANVPPGEVSDGTRDTLRSVREAIAALTLSGE